jgi:hypothetical protein
MKNFQEILGSNTLPEIYWIEHEVTFDEITCFLNKQMFQMFYVNGRCISNKQGFLEHISKVMAFPDYFQPNWDSFEECMLEMRWYSSHQYILFYEEPESFMKNDSSQWSILLDILDSVIKYWNKNGILFYVILKGKIVS